MKNNWIKNIFSSGLQAIAIQILGVLFLYIVSFYLSKDDFGIISWSNAVSAMITTILALGMEQVVFRRVAASSRSDWAAAAFLIHAALTSFGALLILFICSLFFSSSSLRALPFFFAVQSFIYVATPLKQFLNAKQRFAPYGIIAVVSNILKIICAILYIKYASLTIYSVIIVLSVAGFMELAALFLYIKLTAAFSFHFRWKAYTKLIRESLPQYISTIFDASLSRIDWILLGIIGTHAMTGEYSFAYRAFEIARLPITIIAPLLLGKFARLFAGANILEGDKHKVIRHLFIIEAFISMPLLIVLNILWSPVLDLVFHGKYGSNNAIEFMLLSFNIPFLFAINLLWTIAFTGKRYKQVAGLTISSAVINLTLNLCFIPLYGGKGAAIAFLLTTIVQYAFYQRLVSKHFLHTPILPSIVFFIFAIIVYAISKAIAVHVFLQLTIALVLYFICCISSRQIGKEHFKTLQAFFRR